MATLKEYLVKVWTFIRRIPGWVFFTILVLMSVAYFYINKVSQLQAKLIVQSKRIKLEKEKEQKLKVINIKEAEKIKLVRTEYDSKINELKEKEKKLEDITSQGPIALAEAWRKYLSNK